MARIMMVSLATGIAGLAGVAAIAVTHNRRKIREYVKVENRL